MASPRRAVSLVAPDLEGHLRTRHVPADAFDAGSTPCFVDIVFAFDEADALIPRPQGYGGWWPSWDDGFGDLATTPDLGSRRPIGWRHDEDVVFADLSHRDGTACRVAPRQVLRRVRDAVTDSGTEVRVGTEIEFFLGDDPDDPGAGPNAHTAYAFAPPARDRAVLERVVAALAASDIAVQNWYAEGGPRQYELALAPADPLVAADVTLLARHAVEEVAAGHGLRASFLPKPGPGFGSGLHVHLSLWRDGANLLRGLDTPIASPAGSHALAGVLAVLQPATALLSPTPLGYDRLVAHSAAGTSATWAHDNRSAGVRYLDRGDDARIEVRTAASDAQPHLVVAALLAGLAAGLEAGRPPGPAGVGDLYAAGSADTALPADLHSATAALRASRVLRRHLGDDLVDHYAATRDWAASR